MTQITSEVKLSEGAVQRLCLGNSDRSGLASAGAGANNECACVGKKNWELGVPRTWSTQNLEYPSVGQVTDAYEANEISFRYGQDCGGFA